MTVLYLSNCLSVALVLEQKDNICIEKGDAIEFKIPNLLPGITSIMFKQNDIFEFGLDWKLVYFSAQMVALWFKTFNCTTVSAN